MKKRMIALMLAGIMVLSVTACGGGGASSKNQNNQDDGESKQVGVEVTEDMQSAPPEDAPVGGQVVVAISPGTLSPDMYGGWSNNATNSGFIGLMSGYALADYNRDYVLDWDPVVVKDHEVIENDDGSKTYRFEINDNLKWSDGSPITAKDYVFSLLLHSSPEFAACEGDATYGWALVGYNDHVQGTTKEFAGVNLLGDYEFSMTISADQLPNYYEMANVAYGPEPLAAIAPGCDVKDDGNGAYLTDGFTEDLIRETLLDPDKGFRYKAPVVCGPYKLKSVDLTTETVELEINEEYLGTYDGTKPHIQTIISKPVADETIRDEFEKGTIDFYSAGTGEKIEAALTKVEEGKLDGMGIARQFLADPEYITKIKEDRIEDVLPCISCHNACLPTYHYKGVGCEMTEDGTKNQGHCALNPRTFNEKKYTITKTDEPKKVAIIGAGIAGLTAAFILKQRGHQVKIYEKSNEVCGVFKAAAAPSFKEKDKQ